MRDLLKLALVALAIAIAAITLKSEPVKSLDSLVNLAQTNRNSKRLIASNYYFDLALRDSAMTDSISVIIKYNLGENYFKLHKYETALDTLLQDATVADSLRNFGMLVKIYNLAAEIWQDRSIYEKSYVFINLAEGYINRVNDYSLLFNFYNIKRKFFNNTGDLDSAYYYAEKSVEIAKKLNNSESTFAMQNFALQLADLGNIDAFEKINDSILTEASHRKDNLIIGLSYFYFGLVYFHNKRYKIAANYAMQSVPYLIENEAHDLTCEAYKIITDSKFLLGEIAEAYKYQKKYYLLRDSVFNNEATNRLNEISTIYETDKYKGVAKLSSLTIKKQKDVQTGLVVIIALSILLLAMIIQRYFANLTLNNKLKELNEKLENESLKLGEANRLLKISREELQEANDTKDKFFSLIAHDLKNPLTGIKSSAGLLQDYYERLSDEKKKKHISTISESVMRLYTMLENLLDWSRVQTKRITLNPEKTEIYTLVDDCIMIFQNQAADKNITILNSGERGISCFVDTEMIKVAMRNLLSNALKFSKDNSTIVIESFRNDGNVVINVIDQGIGIPDYFLPDIFKLKFNTSRNGTHNEKGSGLGLVLTKEFVELNGGKISVSSELGKGSTFLIELPAHN